MVKFLDTQGVSAELSQIIKNANERLVIISPYLQVSHHIQQLLADIRVPIVLVCRQPRQPKEERQLQQECQQLKKLPEVKILSLEFLHAKCYMNEEQAILTSMNLYQFSQQNSKEMGLLVSRNQESQLYEDIRKEADRFERMGTVILEVSKPKPTPAGKTRPAPKAAPRKPEPSIGIPASGFCIRDKAVIPTDPGKPYCNRCFQSWNRFKNPEYEENHCHICGKENDSTMEKPACRSCYRKYKDVFIDILPVWV